MIVTKPKNIYTFINGFWLINCIDIDSCGDHVTLGFLTGRSSTTCFCAEFNMIDKIKTMLKMTFSSSRLFLFLFPGHQDDLSKIEENRFVADEYRSSTVRDSRVITNAQSLETRIISYDFPGTPPARRDLSAPPRLTFKCVI